MLTLLIGRSGSGKTHQVLESLKQLAADGRQRLLLIVPEQNSFENERALLEIMTPAQAAQVQVLSFTRLADTVFREVGGLAEERLDDGTRALLMSRALELTAKMAEDEGETLLGISPHQVTDVTFVQEMLALLDEVKQCAVPIDELERVETEMCDAATAAGVSLREKTGGLFRIFSVYEGLAKGSGLDSADLLTHLAKRLPESRLARGATVMVDGFKGFTAQELQVLERLLIQATAVTVTLGTDTPGKAWLHTCPVDNRREYTLFSPVTDTVNQLQQMAARHNIPVTTTLLADNHRPDNEALRALEAGLYHPAPAIYNDRAEQVTVTPCVDVYEECAYVARQIRRLMREGVRCRDITIVTRQPDGYRGILEDALEEAGIPYYMDSRQELLCEPLVVYIRTALRMAAGGFTAEELLRLLKTDLGPLTPLETAELENYLYMWRLDRGALTTPFTASPAGMDKELSPAHRRQLEKLESWRQRLMRPLSALRDALRGQVTGRQFALAVYKYLTDDDELPRRIVSRVHALETLGEPLAAEREAGLWDKVIGLLDCFATALGDQKMAAGRLEELFTLLVQAIDMGHIPQGLDTVTVGSADRIRYADPRVVFIVGANEGAFPAYPQNAGILTEEDRRLWEAHGIRLYGSLLRRCIEERYYVYMAVAAPRQRLYVTYLTGGDTAPSPLINSIKAILPNSVEDMAVREDAGDLETGEEAFRRLAANYNRSTPTTEALRALAQRDPLYCVRLTAVARAAGQEPFRLKQPAVAQALFGTDIRLSATQTEQYYDCHFAYFCKYGLRIKPRTVAKLDSSLFGTIVHHVMEVLLPRYSADSGLVPQLKEVDASRAGDTEEAKASAEASLQDMLLERLHRDVHREVAAYAEQVLENGAPRSGSLLYQLQLVERAACNMLWHTVMELRQSDFKPVDYELNILADAADGDGILSVSLPINGGQVRLTGKVDRVDLYVRQDGAAFVRVVDYKTGNKVFSLSDVTQGLNTQMLLYLFIICDNSRRYLEDTGQLQPAGVLYHPLSDLMVDRGTKDMHNARLKSMQMDGVVLDDPGVVLAMDKQGKRVFIPAGLSKDGDVTGEVITAHQFTMLRRVIERLLIQMGNALLAGDIAALPLYNSKHDACKYCDYKAVCGRDQEDPVRELTVRSTAQVAEALEQEEVADSE